MEYQSGIHLVQTGLALDTAVGTLVSAGWEIYRLPSSISNVEQFFSAVREVLPLDPPVRTSGNWDAFSDSLFSGLHSLEQGQIVIVWPAADRMKRGDPEGFQMVEAIFNDVAEALADTRYTGGRVIKLIILEGRYVED